MQIGLWKLLNIAKTSLKWLNEHPRAFLKSPYPRDDGVGGGGECDLLISLRGPGTKYKKNKMASTTCLTKFLKPNSGPYYCRRLTSLWVKPTSNSRALKRCASSFSFVPEKADPALGKHELVEQVEEMSA